MPSLTANRGIVSDPNELTRPDGAMEVLDNCVIDSDNIVESRRGFEEFGNEPDGNELIKQLLTYKGRILRHFDDKLSFDSTGNGTFLNFAGSYSELVSKLRIRSIEANSNLYFTTAEGIKKISATSASDFTTNSGYITNAGGIKATSIEAKIKPISSGWLPAQSKVAYKVVWVTKDANNYFVRGVPSSRVVVSNTSQDVNVGEEFTISILNYAGIVDSQYFLFDTPTNKYGVWFKTTSTINPPVATELVGRQLVMVDIEGLSSNGSVAAKLAEVIFELMDVEVEVGATIVTIRNVDGGDVLNAGQGNLTATDVLVSTSYNGQTAIGTPANVDVTFVVPNTVNTATNFYEIYRTAVTTVQTGLTLADIDPGEEFQKVYEAPVTQADITAGQITIEDIIPEIFRESGIYLYTNAATGEDGRGALSANEVPPISRDIAFFKNAAFYANTKERHRLQLSLLSVSDFVSGTSKFYIGNQNTTSFYTFVGVSEEITVTPVIKDLTVGGSYVIINSAQDKIKYKLWFDKGTITRTVSAVNTTTEFITTSVNHGFANGDLVVASGTLPGGVTAGNSYYIRNRTLNSFQLSSTPTGSIINITSATTGGVFTHDSIEPSVADTISLRVAFDLYPGNTLQDSIDAIIEAFFNISDFEVEQDGMTVKIYNMDNGDTTDPVQSSPATGWTFSVTVQGNGEDASANEVLLSGLVSVGQSVEDTAKSLERVINKDPDSPVNAYYTSGLNDLPGQLVFEARDLTDTPFYLGVAPAAITSKFNPELPEAVRISNIAITGNLFTTSTAHGFSAGDSVIIHDNPSGVPLEFSGVYKIATTPAGTTFTLEGVTVQNNQAGINGVAYEATVKSDNSVNPNRVYFSKTNQPEAVPLVNYIDIGTKDKPIQRIIALRDSLMVLKEDGIFVITGSNSPDFSSRLVDSSAVVFAPDTAMNLNNLIYALSTQGVITISDTGVGVISRNIENKIKEVTNARFDYKLVSWGIASESDRAYILWLPTKVGDAVATQAYRYNLFTRAWTRWTKPANCGVINPDNDKIYLGDASSRHYILEERKNLDRTDYADRSFVRSLGSGAITGSTYILSSVTDVEAGDVLVQEQYLDINKFNRTLKKLDRDTLASDDYYSTLRCVIGDNLAEKVLQLSNKINADGITVPTGTNVNTKEAIRTDFNAIISVLNNLSTPNTIKNYKPANDLLSYETLILDTRPVANTITVKIAHKFVEGEVKVYKAIKCLVRYVPQHFGKPEVTKQVKEGTFIFERNNFWGGTTAYSSDRSYDFNPIAFSGRGPGYWDGYNWAEAVYGGEGNEVPVRTLVPIDKARCRYLHIQFTHSNAREVFRLLGVSVEVREVSSRGYR